MRTPEGRFLRNHGGFQHWLAQHLIGAGIEQASAMEMPSDLVHSIRLAVR